MRQSIASLIYQSYTKCEIPDELEGFFLREPLHLELNWYPLYETV